MAISNRIKEIIKDPKMQFLIDNNKWKEIYTKLRVYPYDDGDIGKFTQLLQLIDINPLNYMDYIPSSYLSKTNITNFDIPSHVRVIGNNAFRECYKLQNIIIPDNVVTIGFQAFENCKSLKDVQIGNNLNYIDYGAFARCTSITSIVIPDSVTSIGNYAFGECVNLTNLILGANLKDLSMNFINDTNIKEINYNNTMENWKKVTIKRVDTLKYKKLIFDCKIICTDGVLKIKDAKEYTKNSFNNTPINYVDVYWEEI